MADSLQRDLSISIVTCQRAARKQSLVFFMFQYTFSSDCRNEGVLRYFYTSLCKLDITLKIVSGVVVINPVY